MGGGSSVPKSLYTPEEQVEIDTAKSLQSVGLDFVKKDIFNDIPIRTGKKSADPTAALWIEPIPIDPASIQDTEGRHKVTEEILMGFPTGALVDRTGKIKVLFSLAGIEYVFHVSDTEAYAIRCKSMDGLPDPSPPVLTDATTTSIALRWSNTLPFPLGIIQAVEVQYAIAPGPSSIISSVSFDMERSGITQASTKSENAPSSPHRWFALVSRTYAQNGFESYKWGGLLPGSHYIMRMRYRTSGVNWSEYSEPSSVYSTMADKPRAPPPPVCVPITSFAVQIIWGPTNQRPTGPTAQEAASLRKAVLAENGSPITEYILVGRSVGEDDYIELYRGPSKTYLLLGLFAENAYTFKLSAVNAVGMSEFSQAVSVQTPARPVRNSSVARSIAAATAAGIDLSADFGQAICVKEADADKEVIAHSGFTPVQIQIARQCREAWREYWDSSSEQTFYFNSILSIRQLEVPAVLRNTTSVGAAGTNNSPTRRASATQQSPSSSKSILTAETTTIDPNSPEVLFRKKRYRLLHALRKKTTNFARSKDIVHLELERPSMLADCFQAFEKLGASDFRRRFKVSFVGEQGLDSGGLSKEAFLLLTKQAAYYMGPKYHQWIRPVVSTILVPREKAKNVVVATTDADKAKEKEAASGLNATNEEGNEAHTAKDNLLEEQVEGYFLSPKTATNTSEIPAPKPATRSRNNNKNIKEDANKDDQKGAQKEEADLEEGGLTEACYQSILVLDTERRVTSAQFFSFLGRLLGKALYDRQLVDFPLSSLLLKHLLGEISTSAAAGAGPNSATNHASASELLSARSVKDNAPLNHSTISAGALLENTSKIIDELRFLDQELHKSLLWMSCNDITGIIYETFSVTDGATEFPLCAHGESKEVTEENKYEYIRLMIQWKTTYSVLHNLTPFLEAFYEIIPLSLLRKAELNPEELNLMLNGKREVDVEDMRAFCVYQGSDAYFNETHDSVIWFWQALRAFSQAERRLLLKFFTGSARVPLDGYDPPLNVTQGVDMALNSLPRAHTCFNQIVLPKYSNAEMCIKQLRFAMHNTEGFDFA